MPETPDPFARKPLLGILRLEKFLHRFADGGTCFWKMTGNHMVAIEVGIEPKDAPGTLDVDAAMRRLGWVRAWAAERERDEARATAAALLAELRRVGDGVATCRYCPICGECARGDGHTPDCSLAAALRLAAGSGGVGAGGYER